MHQGVYLEFGAGYALHLLRAGSCLAVREEWEGLLPPITTTTGLM